MSAGHFPLCCYLINTNFIKTFYCLYLNTYLPGYERVDVFLI